MSNENVQHRLQQSLWREIERALTELGEENERLRGRMQSMANASASILLASLAGEDTQREQRHLQAQLGNLKAEESLRARVLLNRAILRWVASAVANMG